MVCSRRKNQKLLTDDPRHLREVMDWIDQSYLGELCQKCQRRSVGLNPIA
jgi:hypothetical protein